MHCHSWQARVERGQKHHGAAPRSRRVGNQVYALAESVGAITNFALTSWTQPVVFQLINPLLGRDCTIETLGNPVVLNPSISISSGQEYVDPNPTEQPPAGSPLPSCTTCSTVSAPANQ
jgi:hypothetical protein